MENAENLYSASLGPGTLQRERKEGRIDELAAQYDSQLSSAATK